MNCISRVYTKSAPSPAFHLGYFQGCHSLCNSVFLQSHGRMALRAEYGLDFSYTVIQLHTLEQHVTSTIILDHPENYHRSTCPRKVLNFSILCDLNLYPAGLLTQSDLYSLHLHLFPAIAIVLTNDVTTSQ